MLDSFRRRAKSEAVEAIRWADAMVRTQTKRVLVVESILAIFVLAFVATPMALAVDFDIGKMYDSLNKIATNFLLPVGIAWASWQIVYVAVVCGIIGIDPLNLVGGDLDQDHVWAEVRNRFRNFAYGIAWVAGIWLLFEFVLFVVTKFANIIGKAF